MIQTIVQFLMENWRILLLIYAIGALLTFIGVNLFWVWVIRAEDKEREMYPEEFEDVPGGVALQLTVALITSTVTAVIWVGVPLILAFVLIFDKMANTFPEIMGYMAEDFEEEKDND